MSSSPIRTFPHFSARSLIVSFFSALVAGPAACAILINYCARLHCLDLPVVVGWFVARDAEERLGSPTFKISASASTVTGGAHARNGVPWIG